jgi:tRNA (mo5U34)-methyltransferase
MSMYDINEKNLGTFDLVFFFGTIYHLRYPLLALDIISAICEHELYLESAILDDYSPYQGGVGKGYAGSQMIMEFYPGGEFCNNESNWWCPTLYCLLNLVSASGFEDVKGLKLTEKPLSLQLCRGFVTGTKS